MCRRAASFSALGVSILAAACAISLTPAVAQEGTDSTQVEEPERILVTFATAQANDAQPESPSLEAPQQRAISPVFSASATPNRSLLIAGYADATLAISDDDSSFSGTFNPALYYQYGNFALLESEMEISSSDTGETEITLEFGQIDLFLHDNVTLVVGKFLSPVGQFQERLHPSWINRLADAPAGFGHDGLQPGAEVGLQLRGGIAMGEARFAYALAVGNGPQLEEDGAVMLEGFGRDDNDNKAISGRLGFLPTPHLEVGASFLRAEVQAMGVGGADPGVPMPNADFDLWGLDAAYTRGPWDVRAEYLRGTRGQITLNMDGEGGVMLPRLKMEAWYAQAGYRISGITQHPILRNFEPVVRYGEFTVDGLEALAEEVAERRTDVGLNYWFAPAVVLHAAIQRRRFTDRSEGEDRSDTRFLLQVSYGF